MAEHHAPIPEPFAAPAALRNLSRTVVTLLQKWNLSEEQQLALLGIDAHDGAALAGYPSGVWALPDRPDVLRRIALLLGIHRALRLLFPENEELRFSWVCRRNVAFGGVAPIDVMLRDGADGIRNVRSLLDQQCMQ